MRSSRVLLLFVVIALLIAPLNAFGKVCHPKKPITCHAAVSDFGGVALSPAPAPKAKPAAVNTNSPVKSHQQAMVCFPLGGRFICKAPSPVKIQQYAMVCFPLGGRFICKAPTLS